MKRAIIEGRAGGRCYTEQVDGTDCDWGTVLVWEPPRRFVMAWQVTHEWGYEPDIAKSSEVEVRFTPESDGRTRVDLEHRNFERHGAGGEILRASVDSTGGWGELLKLFATQTEKSTENQ
jgi:Activator of Hsp90 ATPase homolog 1-like protein